MRAIVQHGYCRPDGLELRDVAPPAVRDDEVLVRVRAASVNPYDWHFMTGEPYLVRMSGGLRRPRNPVPGADLAGTVEAVGRDVTLWRPGDDVFGFHRGSFAEYVSVPAGHLAGKPTTVTFEQAAAVPIAGLTALQGLRDRGRVRAGQQVLVNGASGGVGTFAVQIARLHDATVTAVCSTVNVATAHKLGAHRVLDYTADDFVAEGTRYDLVFDIAGSRGFADLRRVLRPDGTLVFVGGAGRLTGPDARARGGGRIEKRPKMNRWVGPLARQAVMRLRDRRMVMMLASPRRADLETLADMLAEGTVVPEIERVYPLDGVPAALERMAAGHARGKLVISV
jgi:NADPH:quinone reductase-like Zn-dependent oxidoreductase